MSMLPISRYNEQTDRYADRQTDRQTVLVVYYSSHFFDEGGESLDSETCV